jgi:peptidoglycan/LPS O-acetylase OafA/YrhL
VAQAWRLASRMRWSIGFRDAAVRACQSEGTPRSTNRHTQANYAMKRIPSLDGFRALSIFMVVASHIWNAGESRYGWHSFWGGFLDGVRGVSIFFVISGYLITKLLLVEYDRRATYSLGRFYYRRFFRIVPPLYVYILFVVVSAPLSGLRVQPLDVLTASTFTRNLVFPTHNLIAHGLVFKHFMFEHFWSLVLEEQFYLCWPLALLFVLRHFGRIGAIRLATGLILFGPIYRIAIHVLIHDTLIQKFAAGLLPGYMDGLMFGCLAAVAEGSSAFENAYAVGTGFVWFMPIWFFGISAALTIAFGGDYRLTIGQTADGVAVVMMLLWTVRNSTSFIGRVLNWGPVVHVGLISYSLYIWQTYFFIMTMRLYLGDCPGA